MKRVNIGGQAVLEGVMMKGPKSYALAVRKPDNEIEVKVTEYKSFGEKHKGFSIPILRGVVNFIESLYIGMKTLMDSSEYFEEEEATNEKTKAEETKAETVAGKDEKKESSNTAYLVGTLAVSLIIAIGVFMLLPAFLANFLYKVIDNDFVVNLAEGLLRLAIFLGYVALIAQMEDIKRTFMYHGAEHKSINCMEAGMDLTVENVRKASRFHKRCGTSFVFIVMFISIFVFMFVRTDVMWLRLVSRVALIPVIAGISYEFIRYAGKHQNACSNILSAPGLWVQKLTTKEPDDDMIEVAIKSVEGVIDWHEYVECVRNDSFEK
ncbi:MAG: DUF1385 domain-containing protein [Eubacterium sp.]|nr:DUF1385 domain-containing protein [Eubacterium sp.]